MSKIGRQIISTVDVQVEIKGQEVQYKGPKAQGVYVLPEYLTATHEANELRLALTDAADKEHSNFWGLHKALLANTIAGARQEFKVEVKIVGLGFKAELKGSNSMIFSLGYSHKINFDVPAGITITLDKTGQNITISSSDKFLAGDVAQKIRALRKPEPYKGTGICLATEVIRRKAGKTKGD